MREVVIRTWCDQCDQEGLAQQEGVEQVALGLDGPPLSLDLCASHAGELVALRKLLASHGQPIDAPEPSPKRKPLPPTSITTRERNALPVVELSEYEPGARARYRCPLCGKLGQSIRQHLQTSHGLGPEAVRQADGYHCPLCENVYPKPIPLGQHVANEHGTIVSIVLALRQVAEQQ